MKSTTPTIVLTGGGTGGHLIPIASLAHALKQKNSAARLIFIGLRGGQLDKRFGANPAFSEAYYISAGKFRRYHGRSWLAHLLDIRSWLLNIRDFFRVIAGSFSAWRILRKTSPDLVFSKGGFVAVPVGLAARLLKIPIVTHDSDALPGLANRIVGRWARINATGLPAEHYNYPEPKLRHVGIPTDPRVQPVSAADQARFKEKLGIDPGATVLLAVGGGLGSKTINELVVAIAPELLGAYSKLRIIQITGVKHEADIKRQQQELATDLKKRLSILGFSDEFYKYSGAADLIIARGGASTLAEFALQGKACLIIPAAFLTGGHQLKNANELAKRQAIKVLHEPLSPDQLLAAVKALLDSPEKRRALAQNLSKTADPDSATKLAEILLTEASSGEGGAGGVV